MRDRQDVVDFLHRGKPSFLKTYFAERMCRGVPVTDTSPRMPVFFIDVRTAFILVILAAFLHTMFLAVLSIT